MLKRVDWLYVCTGIVGIDLTIHIWSFFH